MTITKILRANLLMPGNFTMPKYVGVFNLPAISTCKPSDWCEKHCYATKGRFKWSTVRKAHDLRLGYTFRDDFAERRIAEISSSSYPGHCRI